MHLAIALSSARKQTFQIKVYELKIQLAVARPIGYLQSAIEDLNSKLARNKFR